MMYSLGSYSAGSIVWLPVHFIFGGLAIFGAIVAIIWMAKYAKKETVKNALWTSLIIGILGVLLTAPVAARGWSEMMQNHHGWNWGGELDQEDFEE